MDDKTTTPSETTEYKYTESEGVSAPTEIGGEPQVTEPVAASETKPAFSLKSINWKRLAVPGTIVVSILVLYLGFTFYSSKKTSISEQQKVMVQEKAAMAERPTMELVATPALTATEINKDQLTQIQNAVQQKIDSMLQQVANSSQASITTLNETVTKTQQDYAALSQKVEQLTLAVQQMFGEIEKIKTPPKSAKKRVAKLPVAYHIRAIVPGRVWLESANGKSVTLRVGDKLEGYGEVRVISPRQGMVVMSNGSIIQYGVNDF